MAVGFAIVGMGAELPRSDDVREVLDRSRSQQRMPVRSARHDRERRRNREQGCAVVDERPEQLGKTNIVADRQPESPRRRIHHGRIVARIHRVRLAVGLLPVRQIDVEQVNLAINGPCIALVVDDDAGAVDALRLRRLERHAAADDPHAVLCRGLGKEILNRTGSGLFCIA